MSVDARITSLERRHAELEQQLHALAANPAPDEVATAHLKREKLRLKDEMRRLRN